VPAVPYQSVVGKNVGIFSPQSQVSTSGKDSCHQSFSGNLYLNDLGIASQAGERAAHSDSPFLDVNSVQVVNLAQL
jgi:hypothetical protein